MIRCSSWMPWVLDVWTYSICRRLSGEDDAFWLFWFISVACSSIVFTSPCVPNTFHAVRIVSSQNLSPLLVNWGTSLYEFIVVASLAQWHGWATRGRHNKIHRDGNSVHWQHLLYKYCSISVSASGSVVVLKMFPCSSSPDSNDQLIIKLCWSLMTSFSSEVLQQRNMYNMLGRPRTRLKHRQCLWWWKPWTITDHWPVRKDAALCSSFNMLHDSKTECRWWKL